MRRLNRREGTKKMSVAPKPILGLHVDPAMTERERRHSPFGRLALSLCSASTVVFVIYLGILAFSVTHQVAGAPYSPIAGQVAGLLSWVSLLCQILGLPLGVYARRTKSGKAAIIMALVTDLITVLLFAGFVMQSEKAP